MNIQTAQMKTRKKQTKEHSDWSIYCGIILKLIVLLLLFFAVANAYIYLNQQIQFIERDNASVNRKIEIIEREIKNSQNRYEHASSRRLIDRQIAKFNLKLREPDHSQIKFISINNPDKSARKAVDKKSAYHDNHSVLDRKMADIDRPVR